MVDHMLDNARKSRSETAKQRTAHLAYMTEKAAQANLGKKRQFSEEHKKKLSDAAKGRKPKYGELNPSWKGFDVGYNALHAWVRRNYGSAENCEVGLQPCSKSYDWSNLSGEYKRDRSDWKMMCRSCHMKYDHKVRMRKGFMIEFQGQTKNIKEWAEHFGVKYTTLYSRIKTYQMPIEEAFLKAVNPDKKLRVVENVH
jgi:hypothetical protein